ncbi:hypothetical protein HPB50_027511 [Hyalomma asiaticum]|uniref:Uncharacterized protein n=1 Tax=Hyalomma asiaticum TaxID=266040 RepID=A0ACB7T727_HYAAI|nr:hypothetical protein HPB50_027511 [Hyalomma asiaticum]
MEKNNDIHEPEGPHDEESSDDECSFYGDVVVAIAIVVATGVLLGSLTIRSMSRSGQQQLAHQNGSSGFCCPDKVKELVPHINSTLDPCDNFFDYACSNSAYSRFMTDAAVDSSLERFVATGVPPEHHRRGGDVAEFLVGYFRSCVASIGRRELFVSQMAHSILRVAQDMLRHPNARNSLQFMVEMTGRYMIPSVLEITYDLRKSRMSIYTRAMCEVRPISADCLNASVNGVRSAISPFVSISETEVFMAQLCQHFPATLENGTLAWRNATETISTELWKPRDVLSAMSAVGWEVSNATVIDLYGLHQVRAIRDVFAMEGDCGPKAAYLLWHSVLSASQKFLPTAKPSYLAGFEHCMRKARYGGGNLWQRLRDEVVTPQRVDDQVTATFAAVKRAVLHDAESSRLFDDDVEPLRSLIDGLHIVTTTTQGRTQLPVQVPRAVGAFAENVLQMNDYVHAADPAGGAHLAEPLSIYENVRITDARDVHIAPRLYDTVENASSSHSFMMNMVFLGHDLAEAIWDLILWGVRWNQSTASKLQLLRTCFVERYALYGQQREVNADVIAPSLALASVVRAVARSADWHTKKLAWSTVYMSQAQLFFLLSATRRCPLAKRTPKDEQLLVTPFMYVTDFARAFSCAPKSTMGRPSSCKIAARTA